MEINVMYMMFAVLKVSKQFQLIIEIRTLIQTQTNDS
jgi:hypothetical protein